MLEIQTGVFVGSLSALVRDLLWKKCREKVDEGRCCQVYSTNNEQGYAIRVTGDSCRSVVSFDGLALIAVKNARWRKLFATDGREDGSLTS